MIDADTLIIANPGIASSPLGDKVALLDLENSTYFSINTVGAAIWDSLKNAQTPSGLVNLVRNKFDVGDADVSADISDLLDDLLRLKLIRLVDD